MGQQMCGPLSSNGWSIRQDSEGWGFESPSGRDIFCLKNFDTFTRIPVRVSKLNDVARAQLTFQMLTLLPQLHNAVTEYQTYVFKWYYSLHGPYAFHKFGSIIFQASTVFLAWMMYTESPSDTNNTDPDFFNIRLKHISNSNPASCRLPVTYLRFTQSFSTFANIMAVILPCSV